MDVMMNEAHVEKATNALLIEVRDGLIYVADQQLRDEEVNRSSLLKELLDSNGSTSVPLSLELFNKWRFYVGMEMDERPSEPETHSQGLAELSNATLHDNASLLEAADVLIDDVTVSAAAKAIAQNLTTDDEVVPLLESFVPSRALQVLRAAPVTLSRLLRSLPHGLHPLIIESKIESASLAINDDIFPVSCRPPPGLSRLTFLTSLSLPHTEAAACDPALLAPALKPLIALVHLNLHDCGLTATSASMLADAIAGLTAMQHLDLSANTLLRSGVETLLPSLEALVNITHLSLATNSVIGARTCISDILRILSQLKSLDLTNNSALCPDPATDATKQGADMPAETPVTKFALPPLQDLLLSSQALHRVDIVSFLSPILLGVASTLTRLHLSDNSLTSAADLLCSAMQHMPHLRDLDVRGCGFAMSDLLNMLESLAVARASSGHAVEADEEQEVVPALESLCIGEVDQRPPENEEDTMALSRLVARCTSLLHLDMSCVDAVLHPEILAIQNLTSLTRLDVSQNLMHVEFAENLTALQGLVNLKACAMLEAPPGDAFMAALALFTALTELDLSENGMDDAVALARAVRELTALQHLNLAENDLLQPASPLPAALEVLAALQTLVLSGNPLTVAGAHDLAQSLRALTGLTSLMLDEMCEDADTTRALSACLPALTGLSTLLLSENELPGCMQPLLPSVLSRMSSLQQLQLGGAGLKSQTLENMASAITALPRLSVLGLGGNVFSASAADAIGKAVACLDTLRELDLSSSRLGHKGLMMLAPSIREFKVLQVLDLGDVGVKDNKPVHSQGWATVLHALASLPGLRELELGANFFTRPLVSEHIAPHMSKMTALQALDIEDCSMNADTVTAWMAAIAPLTGLNAFAIGGNTLPANIGDLVAQLTLLEDISLRDSGLSDNDLHVLCGGLSTLAGLRTLTLSANDLSDVAVARAAEALPRVLIEFEQDDDVVSVVDEDESDDEGDSDELGSDGSVDSS